MKKILLVVSLFVNSCAGRRELNGTWTAGNYNLWEKGISFLQGRQLEMSNVLVLNTDSSWRLTGTCQVFEGSKWTAGPDSLFLYRDRCRNVNGRRASFSNCIAYKIKRAKLERISSAFFLETAKKDSLIKHYLTLQEVLKHTQLIINLKN